jgi:O-antigen ligase
MAETRLARIDVGAASWLLLAVVLAVGAGLLVAAAPEVALDLAVIAAAAVAVVRHPLVALIVILALRAALPNSVLIGFLALGAGAVALLIAAPRLPGKRVALPLLGLLLIALASTPLLPSPDEGPVADALRIPWVGIKYGSAPSGELLAWVNLASVLVMFCLAAWAVTTRARLRALVTTVLVSSLVPIAIGFEQLATGQTVTRTGSSLRSVQGPFTFPNYFAFYLVVIIVVALVVVLESRSLATRTAVGGLLIAALVSLFLTYTRSAWVGLAIAVAVLAVLRYRRLLVIAAVAALLAALVAPTAAKNAQQRFGDITTKSEAESSNSWTWRLHQWRAIVPYGRDRPLTGQGFGSYSRLTVRHYGHFNRRYPTVQKPRLGVFSPEGFTAHNDYVRLFVELGFPGLLLWILVFVGLIGTAARARRVPAFAALGTATLALAIALMAISVSDNLLGYTVVLMYAFALCGALAGATSGVGAQVRRGAPLRPAAPAQPVAIEAEPVDAAEPSDLELAPPDGSQPRVETAVRRRAGLARLGRLFGRRSRSRE